MCRRARGSRLRHLRASSAGSSSPLHTTCLTVAQRAASSPPAACASARKLASMDGTKWSTVTPNDPDDALSQEEVVNGLRGLPELFARLPELEALLLHQ